MIPDIQVIEDDLIIAIKSKKFLSEYLKKETEERDHNELGIIERPKKNIRRLIIFKFLALSIY